MGWPCPVPLLPAEADACPIPHVLKKERAVNWLGLLAFVSFLAAFGFYIYARMAHTLGLGGLLW